MIALGVQPPPPQGVHVSSDARVGPISAGGAIDSLGVRGCVGLTASAELCGDVNSPIPLPIPALPVPRVDPIITPAG